MKFLINILELLRAQMECPPLYGWFHLTSVFITIAVSVLLCVFFRNANERTERRLIFILWIIMAVLEVYKQILYTFTTDGTTIAVDYTWPFFPFQLCSTPLYTLPLIAFCKSGKFRDAIIGYTIAFSTFGGICVYAFPGDVFTVFAGINIQTMVHHGIQIITGVYLASKHRHRLTLRYYLSGGIVCLVAVLIAHLLNEVVHRVLVSNGNYEVFNMFYISPYHGCTLPVLSSIYPLVPYPVFLAIYIVGFIVAAAIIFLAARGIVYLAHNLRMRFSKQA